MALALQHTNYVHQDANRIRTVINEVSKNISDSNGNFKSWVVKSCWQELSLNGIVYRRFLGETHCLIQRGILGQPQPSPVTFMSHGRSPLLTACPRDTPLLISSSPVHLLSLRHGTVEQRVERLVQLLIAAGLSDAPDSPQSAGKAQPRHMDSAHSKSVLPPRLLALLASTVTRLASDGIAEDSRKVLVDLVRGEKVLLLPVDKQGQSFKTELLQLIDEISNQLIAGTAAQSKPQQKTAVDRSVVVLLADQPHADKPSLTHSGQHRPAGEHRLGINNTPDGTRINPGNIRNNPDSARPDAQKVNSAPVNGAANKPGMPAAPVPASLSATMPSPTPLSSILASAVPAAMQPIPLAESGQKQLPPIILPTVGQGPGNRSERKKSKKERDEEEEEERERSRHPYLFDDEDDFEDEE